MSNFWKKLRIRKKSLPPIPPPPDYTSDGSVDICSSVSGCSQTLFPEQCDVSADQVILCEEYDNPWDFKDCSNNDSCTESCYTSPYQSLRPLKDIQNTTARKASIHKFRNILRRKAAITTMFAEKMISIAGKNNENGRGSQLNLSLNLYNVSNDNSSKIASRKKLALNFGFPPIPVASESIDVSIPLEKQGWFHGSIRRLDAENLLRNAKEGSFLIRNSESTKQDYSLSLKSAKGFMHMKIVKQNDGTYVLGVFSKPFNSIPDMVKHYTINKLPIRGAEHMSLQHPVIDQLL